jgi:hypothetical protein
MIIKHLKMRVDSAAVTPCKVDNVHTAVVNFCGVEIPGLL